jgi:DNA-binding GntR family transcriptional regulator
MSINLRHKAHEGIKNKIISLEMKPGDVIREGGIARELGMGRTPVREALLMLEQERLVECRSNMGYVVRRLSQKEAEDYYALREALEQFSAPLIIERITPERLQELEAVLTKSENCAAANDVRGVAAYNVEFHALLYRATESEAFVELIFQLIDKIRWLLAMSVASPEGPAQALVDHRCMVAAIRKGDVEGLKEEIRLHLRHAKDRYLSMAAMLL